MSFHPLRISALSWSAALCFGVPGVVRAQTPPTPLWEEIRELHGQHEVARHSFGSRRLLGDDGVTRVAGVEVNATQDGRPLVVEEFFTQQEHADVIVATSRVIPAEVRPIGKAERQGRSERLGRSSVAAVRAPSDTEVALRAAGTSPVVVLVALEPLALGDPDVEVESRRVAGDLNEAEVQVLRRERLRAHKASARKLAQPWVDAVEQNGGAVRAYYPIGNVISAELPADRALALLHRAGIRSVDLVEPAIPDTVDGREALIGVQAHQWVDSGFDGTMENSFRHSWGHLTLGVIDTGFNSGLPAMKDDASASRVIIRYDCVANSVPCQWVSAFNLAHEDAFHGTRVAAIAAGDLFDGQDSGVTTDAARRARSGLAPEARLMLFRSDDSDAFCRAIDKATDWFVDVVNVSQSYGFTDPEGTSAASACLNDAVRVGNVFVVKSAGNRCHDGSSPSCTSSPVPPAATIGTPGAAAFSFTVGSVGDSITGDASTVKTWPLTYDSSQGGVPYFFGTRSVVSMVAPGCRALVPSTVLNGDGSTGFGYFDITGTGCGTSQAAPVIAGAAIDLKDWWLSTGAQAAPNSPERIQAALMLMGDREGMSGHAGLNKMWGAGRFRARKFNAAGMDAPWEWGTASIVVTGEGTVTATTLNGGTALPAAVDRLVVAAWWAEPHQEAPIPPSGNWNGADITLTVRQTCNGSATFTDSSFDTHKRVVLRGANDPGNKCFRIELNTFQLSTNPWAGNAVERTVVYAWYWEGEERDDGDGPTSAIQ